MPGAPDEAPFTDDELDAVFLSFAARRAPGAILAVSGGSDSLAMLHLARRWRDVRRARGKAEVPLIVATVDHGLRADAATEAKHMASLAAAWGFEHVTLRWEGEKPATGLQEAAREARYALLVALAKDRGLARIATAHTVDDLAETFLMRLSRGSGLEGLAGVMRGTRRQGVSVVRPLLDVSRARLRAELTREGITWIDDPSNADERFTRVRWRKLMPLLAAEGLDARRIADVSLKLHHADTALESVVRQVMARRVKVERAGASGQFERFSWVRDRMSGSRFDATRRPTRVLIATRQAASHPVPFEVLRRILAIAVEAVGRRPELAQLEQLIDDVDAVGRSGQTIRRTLGGCLITYEPGWITIAPEPPRRLRKTTQTG